MNNYSHEMTLNYNQVYSYHPKYRHYYIDFLNNNLKNNTSVLYPDYDEVLEETILRIGLVITKDHTLYETKDGIITKITLKSVPFIRTNNGTLIINTGKNCASI